MSDPIGQTFNRLTVLGRHESSRPKKVRLLCRCVCGNETIVERYRVKGGIIKSCGCLGREVSSLVGKKSSHSFLGRRFGRLLVIQRLGTSPQGNAVWLCLCSCGATTTANANHLAKGATKSCGCFRRDASREKARANVTHGMSKTREYKNFVWNQRRERKLQATPKWADIDAISEFYKHCPKGFHVDHVLPLMGKLICGLNIPENLQYLPARENEKKSNTFEPQILTMV